MADFDWVAHAKKQAREDHERECRGLGSGNVYTDAERRGLGHGHILLGPYADERYKLKRERGCK